MYLLYVFLLSNVSNLILNDSLLVINYFETV